MTSLKKVFFSHLHADQLADYITLIGSYTKAGRLDPVGVWGGGSDHPALRMEGGGGEDFTSGFGPHHLTQKTAC